MRVSALLDTGVGPKFVRRRDLPSTDVQISVGLKPTTSDANCRNVNIARTAALYVRYGTYIVKINFYVCERLGTDYVLGGEFCDMFVETIKPRQCLV